jgi:MFS family permease
MTDRPAGPLRRFLDWYFGAPGRRVVVWTVWAAMTVLAGGYIREYGPNMPVYDEWTFVPVLYGPTATKWEWVVERHAEHRYPLARLLYLGLFHATGGDYRAGMWCTLGLLSGAAALVMTTARTARGTTAYSDCWAPILLLHRGHCENLIMGYQIAFTLNVFAVAAFVALVVRSPGWPAARVAWIGVALTLVLALGGGIGLLFAPLVGGWVIWRTVTQPCRTPAAWAAVGVCGAILAYAAVAVADSLSAPRIHRSTPGPETAWTVLQTVGNAFGPALTSARSVSGIALAIVGVAAAGLLLRQFWADREQRAVTLGLLTALAGVAAFAVVIGFTRPNVASPRYAAIAALGPCVILITLAGRFPRLPRWWTVAGAVGVAVGGAVVVRQNWLEAATFGRGYRTAEQSVRADAAAGMTLDLIAERHRYYHGVDRFREYWTILWSHDAGPVRGAAPPAEYRVIATLLPADEPAPDPRIPPPDPLLFRTRLVPDTDQPVAALRLKFTLPVDRAWMPFRFHWLTVDADGRVTAHTRSHNCWVDAGERPMTLWVHDRLVAVWVDLGREQPLPTVIETQLLVPADGR